MVTAKQLREYFWLLGLSGEVRHFRHGDEELKSDSFWWLVPHDLLPQWHPAVSGLLSLQTCHLWAARSYVAPRGNLWEVCLHYLQQTCYQQWSSNLVLMLHSLRTRRRYSFLPPEVLSAEPKGTMAALSFTDLNSLDNMLTMPEAWEAAVCWKDTSGHLPHCVLQQALGEEKTQWGGIGGGKKWLGISIKVFQDISYRILEVKTDPWLNPEEHSAIAWDDYISC